MLYKYFVSLFRSVHATTIMGRSANLTVVQEMVIDTLHREGKPQKVITERDGCSQSAVSNHIHGKLNEGKRVLGKGAQATEMAAALRSLSSKADSRTWENFTQSGMRLELVHEEPPSTMKWATTVAFLVLSHS